MTVDKGKVSAAKTNLYRTGVGQPAVGAADTAKSYCVDLVNVGPARVKLDRSLTRKAKSPDSGAANSLFTFLAQRLNGSFDTLDCGTLLHRKNPVALVTDKQGVVVDARLEAAQVPVPVPTPSSSASSSARPTPSTSTSARPTPTPTPTVTSTPTPTTTATHGPGTATQPAPPLGTPTPTTGGAQPTPTKAADPGPANPGPANPGPANPGPANPGPANPAPANPGQPAVERVPAPGAAGAAPAGTPAGPPAGTPADPSTAAAGSSGPSSPAVVPAKAHHTTVNNASSLRNYAPGAVLAVSGALLTIGTGAKVVHSRRKRRQDWDDQDLDGPDLTALGIVVSRDEAVEFSRRHGHHRRFR